MRAATGVLGLFVCASAAFAAPAAPTILSVQATSSSAILVAWRNNSIGELGFIVYHRRSGDTSWTTRDTVGANVVVDTDKGLLGSTSYAYVVKAYDSTGVSAASNTDSATTQPFVLPPLSAPGYSFSVDSTTGKVSIIIHDLNMVERGYRIYRSDVNDSTLALTDSLISSTPTDTGTVVYNDLSAVPRTLYWYRVDAYRADSAAQGLVDSVYAYLAPALTPIQMQVVGTFALHYTGWALLSGDTLFAKEPAGAGTTLSMISLASPQAPTYLGAADSGVMTRYARTAIASAMLGVSTLPSREVAVEFPAMYAISRGASVCGVPDSIDSLWQYAYDTLASAFVPKNLLAGYCENERFGTVLEDVTCCSRTMGYTIYRTSSLEIGAMRCINLAVRDSIQRFGRSFCSDENVGAVGSSFSDSSCVILGRGSDTVSLYCLTVTGQLHYAYSHAVQAGQVGDPLEFAYPYVVWSVDSSTIAVTNVNQAGALTPLGTVNVGFGIQQLVLDTARNYIVALGTYQAAVVSFSGDLKKHTGALSTMPRASALRARVSPLTLAVAGCRATATTGVRGPIRLTVLNALGRIVTQTVGQNGNVSVDLSRLPSGVYIVNATGGGVSAARVVPVKH